MLQNSTLDNQNCEQCHKTNPDAYIKLAEKGNNQKSYKILHYQRLTSLGKTDHYALCLNCHNSDKELKDGTKNIKQYYEDSN